MAGKSARDQKFVTLRRASVIDGNFALL